MSELKAYTDEELAEHQQLYDEVFTPVWESEGQYCRAGGGQYEKSFAWWAFKNQQSKVDELQKRVDAITERLDEGISAIRKSAEIYEDHFSGYPESDYLRGLANDLEQALKGGSDETN